MSQHSFSIANEAGAAFRADVNNALQALASCSRGASAPGTTYAGQVWDDTTANVQKKRNAANSIWIVKMTIDETFVLSRSSNTILGLSDIGKCIVATSTFTQTVTAAATLGDGWFVDYRNDGTGIITIDPNGAETIDGATTLLLQPGEAVRLWCNGTSFKTVGRQTGLVLLASATASSSASLDFTNLTGYAAYLFVLESVLPATTTTALWLRFSQDNGATFKAGASDYKYAAWGVLENGGTGADAATAAAQLQLVGTAVNTAGYGVSGSVLTNDLAAAVIHHVNDQFMYSNSASLLRASSGGGAYVTDTTAINAARFMFSSGNIASGTIKCYGVRG